MCLKRVQVILDEYVKDIGRAGGMLWITLGTEVLCNEKTRSKYSIHVQCPWRIRKNSNILLASGDCYIPASNYQSDDEMDFKWDILGNNKFDEYVATEKVFFNSLVVEEVHIDEFGAIKIVFSDKTIFETFVDSSIQDEFWRFIEYSEHGSEHLVIFE